MAVRIVVEIERLYKRRLPLATLLQAPTIAGLAEVLRNDNWTPSWSSLVPLRPGGSKPPLFLMHSHGGNVLEYYPLAELLGDDQPVYALQARGLDGRIVKDPSIEEMASNYLEEIRSLQPEGPYFLGGFCFGGLLAIEVAQQLVAAGDEVALLAMIQTINPACARFRPNVTVLQRWGYRVAKRLDLEREFLAYRGIGYFQERLNRVWDLARSRTAIAFDARRLNGYRTNRASTPYILEALGIEHDKAFGRYQPRPYSEDVLLFRASKQMQGLMSDPTLGWRSTCSGHLEVCEVPGHQQNYADRTQCIASCRRTGSPAVGGAATLGFSDGLNGT